VWESKRDNQYILKIMCASTRFPEAIPLRTIRALNIVKALIKSFTLVGLLRSVQSDQGSNFMFGAFQEVMFQLGIKQRKSTAHHPQHAEGLLKKKWDEGIPLLLFAIREIIQESIEFSPFELVFGHAPHPIQLKITIIIIIILFSKKLTNKYTKI